MPLYFAYGANMDVGAMARRCPRSEALGPGRLARHCLAVMREGWLTVARDPRSAVHGVLWDLALADVAALDRYEGMAQGLYVKLTQPVVAERGRGRRSSISAPTPGPEPRARITSPTSSPRRAHGRCRRRRSRRWNGLRQPAAGSRRRGGACPGRGAERSFRPPIARSLPTVNSTRPRPARPRSRRLGSARRSGRPGPGACRTGNRWRSTGARRPTGCRARSRLGRS
jgi:hypothetical protein